MAVPIRYLVLILVILRLSQLGAGKSFAVATLIVGFFSTFGTALMTATPFNLSPVVHKTGIGLYFFGVVILQTIIFIQEWSLKDLPRLLPLSSLALVAVFMIFVMLIVLYEQGAVSRTAPVIWEWLSFFFSIAWMQTQSVLLGNGEATR
ncbi:MAG: hypothetical protein JW726_05445 [Anaerolineales bacterium]|nr:hypothetical protein [Anaerolineales bacterium]